MNLCLTKYRFGRLKEVNCILKSNFKFWEIAVFTEVALSYGGRFVSSLNFKKYSIGASDWLSKNFNESEDGFSS